MKKSRIAGCLKYGDILGKALLFSFLMGLSVFVFALFLIVFLVGDGPDASFLDFTSFIIAFVGMPAMFVASLIFLIKNSKRKKEMLTWLEDAVELKAYSKKIDSFWNPAGILSQAKIQVTFTIDGTKYVKVSENKVVGNKDGYDKIWIGYADREINILYSSKHDQVLILKD